MKFKKIVVCMLIAALSFGAVACTKNDDKGSQGQQQEQEKKELTGSLEEIMGSLYKGLEEEFKPLQNTVLTDENSMYFTGLEKLNGAEGLASEMMISSVAHSVVLLRVKEGTDIEALKTDIKEKVDPRKWICVGVEREEIVVDNIGNTIVLIMDRSSADKIHENFLALAK